MLTAGAGLRQHRVEPMRQEAVAVFVAGSDSISFAIPRRGEMMELHGGLRPRSLPPGRARHGEQPKRSWLACKNNALGYGAIRNDLQDSSASGRRHDQPSVAGGAAMKLCAVRPTSGCRPHLPEPPQETERPLGPPRPSRMAGCPRRPS